MNNISMVRRIVLVLIAAVAAFLLGPDKRWIIPAVILAGAVWMIIGEFEFQESDQPLSKPISVPAGKPGATHAPLTSKGAVAKLLDTSVIIDGRIADVCDTGFLEGTFFIPRFVLHELQRIADSSDPLKRNRGRRGLDVLNRMQRSKINLEILEVDAPETREVDEKLLIIGKQRGAKVVTNDFNLNKVAEIHGVAVLNINDLANSLKPAVLPGEHLTIRVIKEGKESGQGIGYLDDGTMVVVDNGKVYMGQKIEVVVTSALQTAAGRMIFAKKKEEAADIIQQSH